MRALHQNTEHAGIAAVNGFANVMTKYAGAYVAVLGGLGRPGVHRRQASIPRRRAASAASWRGPA
jgi:hypothetical protein